MNGFELFTYMVTVIVMIATPGPVMLLVASAGLKGGYRKALHTIFGTNLASLCLIAISVLVLKGLLSINEQIFIMIKILGCLYILYLAVQLFREAWSQHNDMMHPEHSQHGGFKKGFLVGISNPKDIIFFSAFFPQFVHVTSDLNMSLLLLTVVWVVLDFMTLSLVYIGFNRLSQSRHYGKMLMLCALILMSVALYGIVSSALLY
ncbi:LysE family translocator [Acinetobacter sp. B10A]|uniref:LysE family translocator n=1 Tax=Acinetobacter baretiae TaxID=2605383 RepID=UPI001B3C7B36|nr:LysE family translocator [Acinetobacter baretiae]MBF7685696.1 LysE family translocator [Acinetobacter baretiae]